MRLSRRTLMRLSAAAAMGAAAGSVSSALIPRTWDSVKGAAFPAAPVRAAFPFPSG